MVDKHRHSTKYAASNFTSNSTPKRMILNILNTLVEPLLKPLPEAVV
jgi:hypothetical protein